METLQRTTVKSKSRSPALRRRSKSILSNKEVNVRIAEMLLQIESSMKDKLSQLVNEEEDALKKLQHEICEGEIKAVDEMIDKKERELVIKTQVYMSSLFLSSKINVLKEADNLFQEIKDELKLRIRCRLESDFNRIMVPLLLEALLKMLEDEVIFQTRKTDYKQLITQVVPNVKKLYFQKTNRELVVKFDPSNVPQQFVGRITICNKTQKIMITADILEKADRILDRFIPLLTRSIISKAVYINKNHYSYTLPPSTAVSKPQVNFKEIGMAAAITPFGPPSLIQMTEFDESHIKSLQTDLKVVSSESQPQYPLREAVREKPSNDDSKVKLSKHSLDKNIPFKDSQSLPETPSENSETKGKQETLSIVVAFPSPPRNFSKERSPASKKAWYYNFGAIEFPPTLKGIFNYVCGIGENNRLSNDGEIGYRKSEKKKSFSVKHHEKTGSPINQLTVGGGGNRSAIATKEKVKSISPKLEHSEKIVSSPVTSLSPGKESLPNDLIPGQSLQTDVAILMDQIEEVKTNTQKPKRKSRCWF